MAITTRPCCDELIEPDVPHGARHSGDIPLRQAWMIGQRSAAADERLSRGQPISDDANRSSHGRRGFLLIVSARRFPRAFVGFSTSKKDTVDAAMVIPNVAVNSGSP